MPIIGIEASAGMKPTTPTIGTATDGGTGTTVSVAFTPSTYIGKGTITYTATSSPGSLTGTGSSSPITVSGLTTGTAYTFTVAGATNYGVNSDSSAASNSVTPASPSSFNSIATVTAAGGETSLTFSSIPSTYKSLQVRWIARDTNTATALRDGGLTWTFNNDSTSNYAGHFLYGNGSTATAGAETTHAGYQFTGGGCVTSYGSNTTIYGAGIMDIVDYTSTSKNKTIKTMDGSDANAASTNFKIWLESILYIATTTISSIQIQPPYTAFAAGSTFALYGIKG